MTSGIQKHTRWWTVVDDAVKASLQFNTRYECEVCLGETIAAVGVVNQKNKPLALPGTRVCIKGFRIAN